MADSFSKKEREKKIRKRRQDKLEKKKQKKLDGVKSEEFMYVDETGNLTPTPPDRTKRRNLNIEEIVISTPKKLDSDQPKYVKAGFVKFYNGEKGYGFIEDTATGTDYFMHADNLIEAIKEKDRVVFELGSGPRGPIAIKVKLNKEGK